MERYLSTADVQKLLGFGRTACSQLMHDLGAFTVKDKSNKLVIRASVFEAYMRSREAAARHTPTEQPTRRPKKRPPGMPLLTPDGKIPTRQQLREMEKARGKNDRSKA